MYMCVHVLAPSYIYTSEGFCNKALTFDLVTWCKMEYILNLNSLRNPDTLDIPPTFKVTTLIQCQWAGSAMNISL